MCSNLEFVPQKTVLAIMEISLYLYTEKIENFLKNFTKIYKKFTIRTIEDCRYVKLLTNQYFSVIIKEKERDT